jgi:hypothetical protein
MNTENQRGRGERSEQSEASRTESRRDIDIAKQGGIGDGRSTQQCEDHTRDVE